VLGSVRARITMIAVLVVLLVLVAVGVLLVVTQRATLVDQLDEAVEGDATRLATTVAAGGDVGTLDDDDDDDRLVAVFVDGEAVAVTTGLDDADVALLAAVTDDAATIDGARHRVARADEEGVEVVVAAPTEDIDETVSGLVRTLVLVVPAATLVLGVVVWLLVGRTLRPVERIRAEVEEIGLDQLERRVPQPAGNDEIARLAATMNAMLDRLDRSNQRQQRFVADASHELRTPLTRIRAELELDERDPGHADPATTRRSVLEEVTMLQRMVDELLLLARRDAGATTARELVDLDDLVLEEARSSGGVDTSGVSAAQVLGDRAALRRVVRNLLDNARRHAAGQVTVTVGEADGSAVLVVDDDGPGIPLDHRDEVFERFTRLDDARTGGHGHSGLGLAIVHTVVTDHDGSVTIGDSPLGGARLTVTLPRA
jgi:signal transduction histidine kinase